MPISTQFRGNRAIAIIEIRGGRWKPVTFATLLTLIVDLFRFKSGVTTTTLHEAISIPNERHSKVYVEYCCRQKIFSPKFLIAAEFSANEDALSQRLENVRVPMCSITQSAVRQWAQTKSR